MNQLLYIKVHPFNLSQLKSAVSISHQLYVASARETLGKIKMPFIVTAVRDGCIKNAPL